MATTWVNLKGSIEWAKVYEPDEYAGDKRWSVNFYPANGSEWDKFRKSGMQLEVKENSDGEKFIKLRRPFKRLFGDDVTFFAPPEINGAVEVKYVDKDNKKVTSFVKGSGVEVTTIGEQKLLGNGTVVIANICVFDTAKGKGHRLESLKVLELVEYEHDEKTDDK